MKSLIIACLLVIAGTAAAASVPVPTTGNDLGNVRGGDFSKAHAIINKKCTVCHSALKIDAAFAAGKDMNAIQRSMEKRGAKLTATEQEVLGIYWKEQTPLKQK